MSSGKIIFASQYSLNITHISGFILALSRAALVGKGERKRAYLHGWFQHRWSSRGGSRLPIPNSFTSYPSAFRTVESLELFHYSLEALSTCRELCDSLRAMLCRVLEWAGSRCRDGTAAPNTEHFWNTSFWNTSLLLLLLLLLLLYWVLGQ